MPVYWVDCDDKAARRILLADNRTNDLATYDDDILAGLLTEMASDDDLLGSGWEGDDLDRLIDDLAHASGTDLDLSVGTSFDTGLTPAERQQAWEQSGVRSIILPFTMDEYDGVVAALAEQRATLGADSNSAVVRQLLGL